MLSWLFKKRGPAAAPTPPTVATRPAAPARRTAGTAAPAAPAPAPVVDEQPLLQAALGDDAALLKLATSATLLATRLAAVEALASEDALRQAERNFRSHDRKVHRVAKQRLEAAVTQREARASAQALLARTQALIGEALVPVNHVVAIDREWAALPAAVLETEQQQAFTTLRAQLDGQMRAQDAAQQQLQRWTAEARRVLAAWHAQLATAAEHGSAQDAASLADSVRTLRATRPDGAATAAPDAALARALQDAQQVQARLARLEATAAPEGPAPASPEAGSVAPADGTVEAPPPAPVDDTPPLEGALVRLLEARETAHQRARQPARPAQPPAEDGPPAADTAARQAQDAERRAAQRQRLEGLVQQAESALADGQLHTLQPLLQAIENSLAKGHAALPEALRERVQLLQAERGRLQAWQQWGGARARDDLVAQAEALARLTLLAHPQLRPAPVQVPEPAPASPEAGESAELVSAPTSVEAPAAETTAPAPVSAPVEAAAPAAATVPPAPAGPKLHLKAHGDSIQALRKHWKELDRQGATASAAQWQRFDAALQLAHQPVAALHSAQKAARQDNLAAREALLAALEASPAAEMLAETASPDWRACSAELDRFQTAWRKLGPVEHTVPAASRAALMQRLQAALDRLETPLQQARAAAAAEREQLIQRAEALVPQGGRPQPDTTRQLRELQAAWQDHARRLPLPRGVETALWTRFRAAIDAVFAQRDAAFAARDAELAAHVGEREALLERLATLDAAVPPVELERTLAEVDRAWRQAGELPRGAADALEARFRSARTAAAGWLDAAQRQHWQAQCDTVVAQLRHCEAREDGHADGGEADPAAVERLPAPWQQALTQRRAAAPRGPLPATEVDTLLLRLESTLNLPASPEWQAARQQLKLRALKDAMEGRAPVQSGPPQQAGWLQALLRQAGLDAPQRQRLHGLLAALREAPPGTLLPPGDAGSRRGPPRHAPQP